MLTGCDAMVYTVFEASASEYERMGVRRGRITVWSRSTEAAWVIGGNGEIFFKIPNPQNEIT